MNTTSSNGGDRPTIDAFAESRWIVLWIASLITAQSVALVALIVLFSPSHPLFLTLTLAFLVALEGIYTTRFLSTRHFGEVDRTLYRLAELVTVLVATRVTIWIVTDTIPSWVELGRQLGDFTDAVFDITFVLAAAVILFVWLRAITFAAWIRDLSVTDEEADLIAAYRADKNNFPGGAPLEKNRTALAQQLRNSWAWGGVLLIISTILTTFDFQSLGEGDVQFTQASVAPMLWLAITLYTVLGLWLVSWTRHLAQSARWMLLGVKPNPSVQRFWSRSALKMLLVVAVSALFMPAGSAAPIVHLLSAIFSFVIVLSNWVLVGATKLISLILGLFGTPPPDVFESMTPNSPFSDLPQPSISLVETNNVTLPDFSALAWLLLAAIIAVSFAYFFTDRWTQWPAKLRGLLAKLLSILIPRRTHKETVSTTVSQSLMTPEAGYQSKKKHIRRWSLSGLSSREQMVAIYHRFLQQCAKRGLPRTESQTPIEFASRLTGVLADANEPINDFTGSFHKARYDSADIDPNEVRKMKGLYRSLRRTLKNL